MAAVPSSYKEGAGEVDYGWSCVMVGACLRQQGGQVEGVYVYTHLPHTQHTYLIVVQRTMANPPNLGDSLDSLI